MMEYREINANEVEVRSLPVLGGMRYIVVDGELLVSFSDMRDYLGLGKGVEAAPLNKRVDGVGYMVSGLTKLNKVRFVPEAFVRMFVDRRTLEDGNEFWHEIMMAVDGTVEAEDIIEDVDELDAPGATDAVEADTETESRDVPVGVGISVSYELKLDVEYAADELVGMLMRSLEELAHG